jgi:DNA-binding HxlR family transcriptional regulator
MSPIMLCIFAPCRVVASMSENQSFRPAALCSTVEKAFEILSRKWAALIIRELSGGERHFCEMERGIPSVSARMLTERMRELEAAGIIRRTVEAGPPVRTLYNLTEKGRALIPVMKGIEQWAQAWSDP